MTLVTRGAPIILQAERMQRVEARMERLQAQIATGRRFTAPSEDPALANRAALLERLETVAAARARVIERADTRLALAETAIDGVSGALMRLRELALSGANGTLSASDRAVVAAEVRALGAQVLDLANVRDEAGRFLFAGAADAAPAYAPDAEGGPVVWRGAGAGPGAEAAGVGGAQVPRGPDVFGRDADGLFASIDALLEALSEPDDASRAEAMATALSGLEAAFDRATTARARIGAARARLEAEQEQLAAARLDIARGLAATSGLDLTEAIAALRALGLTLAASQQAFGQIFRFSLFDRLG